MGAELVSGDATGSWAVRAGTASGPRRGTGWERGLTSEMEGRPIRIRPHEQNLRDSLQDDA